MLPGADVETGRPSARWAAYVYRFFWLCSFEVCDFFYFQRKRSQFICGRCLISWTPPRISWSWISRYTARDRSWVDFGVCKSRLRLSGPFSPRASDQLCGFRLDTGELLIRVSSSIQEWRPARGRGRLIGAPPGANNWTNCSINLLSAIFPINNSFATFSSHRCVFYHFPFHTMATWICYSYATLNFGKF